MFNDIYIDEATTSGCGVNALKIENERKEAYLEVIFSFTGR